MLGRFFRSVGPIGGVGPLVRILTGTVLMLAGLFFALLELGVLFIADCGPACQARGEQVAVVLLALVGLAVAAGGTWLVRSGVRDRRKA